MAPTSEKSHLWILGSGWKVFDGTPPLPHLLLHIYRLRDLKYYHIHCIWLNIQLSKQHRANQAARDAFTHKPQSESDIPGSGSPEWLRLHKRWGLCPRCIKLSLTQVYKGLLTEWSKQHPVLLIWLACPYKSSVGVGMAKQHFGNTYN